VKVRRLQLICAALLLAQLPLLVVQTARSHQEAPTEQSIVLRVEGADAARFQSVARELLHRIHVDIDARIVDGTAQNSLLQVLVRIEANTGSFVARRQVDGPVIARADMTYETAELLREALAHSLLSLVDAVVQGQPVPQELQNAEPLTTSLTEPAVATDTDASAPVPLPPPVPVPLPLPLPPAEVAVARPNHRALAPQLDLRWRVTAFGTGSLMSSKRPAFGAALRGERALRPDFGVGAALGFTRALEFTEQSYAISMQRLTLQALATWRLYSGRNPSARLVPFVAISRETAEALEGGGDLTGAQSEWLPNVGLAASLRYELSTVSLEAELGLRAFPRPPRLLVRQDGASNSLFEPWLIQPELGLGVGVSF
jgi:hypothetical protein